MSKIAHELLSLAIPDSQPNFLYGTNRELAQFLFMFHVEQLRDSADEVKTFLHGNENFSARLPRSLFGIAFVTRRRRCGPSTTQLVVDRWPQ
jgi:hypothetical protein